MIARRVSTLSLVLLLAAAGPTRAAEAPSSPAGKATGEPAPSAPVESDAAAKKLLERGIAAYDQLAYVVAAKLLDQALAGALSPTDRVRALDYRAFVAVGTNQRDEAARLFSEALHLDPSHTLPPGLSPRITEPFARVKARVDEELAKARAEAESAAKEKAERVTLAPTVEPAHPIDGTEVRVDADVHDAGSRVAKVALFYRARLAPDGSSSRASALGWSRVDASRTAHGYTATVPGLLATAPGLDYYLVAEGAGGEPLSQQGSPEQPLVLAIAARPKKRSRALLIGASVGAGAVLVGGAIALGVLLSKPSSTVDVTVTSR